MEIIPSEVIGLASSRKRDFQVTQFWKHVFKKGRALFAGLFSRAGHLFGLARAKIGGWPRFWQISAVYLLVLFLVGGIYLWRTAKLRTINPYIEKIDFGELENRERPGAGSAGIELDEPDEPAASSSTEPGESPPALEVPDRSFVWPVVGRSIVFRYGGSTREVLARLDRAVKWSFSKGLGITAVPGEKVCSVGQGRVKAINEAGKPYGKEVIIEHENDVTVYYGALDRVDVKKGDRVAGGEPIATVKGNPESEETYLYLEISEGGRAVDPLVFLH